MYASETRKNEFKRFNNRGPPPLEQVQREKTLGAGNAEALFLVKKRMTRRTAPKTKEGRISKTISESFWENSFGEKKGASVPGKGLEGSV